MQPMVNSFITKLTGKGKTVQAAYKAYLDAHTANDKDRGAFAHELKIYGNTGALNLIDLNNNPPHATTSSGTGH